MIDPDVSAQGAGSPDLRKSLHRLATRWSPGGEDKPAPWARTQMRSRSVEVNDVVDEVPPMHVEEKPMFSRRDVLATAAAGAAMSTTAAAAASFGNPDEPPQGSINAKNPGSVTDPGPQNPAIRDQFPSVFSPPATDVGSMPLTWASFNNAPRRIQDGGWAREVTQADFAISKEISGVNMRLSAGGIRELHWHQANEWALMLTGNCRLTALDFDGAPYVNDVTAGDLWYFPTGVPHSLQGLGPDGCEFLLVFDEGGFSEEDTTLLTDWAIHTPPEVLRKNWGVTGEALDPLKSIPREGRYIFQAAVPPPLGQDKQSVSRD